MSATRMTEGEVVDRFLDRLDESSFTTLFEAFTPQLVGYFRRRGHDLVQSEDLAQEVMLSVYRNAAQVRDRALFRPWLFKIARNAIFRRLTKLTREVPTVGLTEVGQEPAGRYRPDAMPGREFLRWMGALNAGEREVMTLRFVEDWEYHEIAAERSIPIGTVQWRVFNSKKKLAAHLVRAAA